MEMEIGYYRLVKPIEGWEKRVGQLWYMSGQHVDKKHAGYRSYRKYKLGEELVDLIQGDDETVISLDEFRDAFEFAPEGFEQRQKKMSQLFGSMHSIGDQEDDLLESSPQLALPSPDEIVVGEIIEGEIVGEETEEPVIEEPEPETTAVAVRPTHNPLAIKQGLKRVKTEVTRLKNQIATRSNQLKLLCKEQELILKAKTAQLTAQMALANEFIFILNTYLGTEEEVVRIKKGPLAPKDTKIVVRQLMLYMDEETAAAENFAEKGGLDFTNIKLFDAWLRDPEHLQQVLPDEKGIVAFKPRRNDKYYSDNPFVNSEMNRANKCLYLLIRNGETLYRIYTTLWLADVLFPRRDEFEEYFYEDAYNQETKSRYKRPMHPGSESYVQAMQAAEKERRRFYTVLVLIQGLLDRTKVFQPLPVERINVCDLTTSTDHFAFITDAENLLSDGRPTFNEWLDAANENLEVGCRVIGHFPYDNERITPSKAYKPKNHVLHTLTERRPNGFVFKYARTGETVYSGWDDYHGHEAKNRASYLIYPHDRFIINFDCVKVEDMEYYFTSRTNRHKYQEMLPLLRVAINAKKEEQAEEAPFRKLLMGEIIKHHGATIDEAEAVIDELVNWWKFKTREHRALTSDDSKALRMIVSEFGRRDELRRQQNEEARDTMATVEVVRAGRDNLLAVFHRGDNTYSAYCWYNSDNVYVAEEQWTVTDDVQEKVKVKEWTTVDKRHQSWHLLWSHERWANWKIGARALDYLTDDETQQCVDLALRLIKNRDQKIKGYSSRGGNLWYLPLAAVINEDHKIVVYFARSHAVLPERPLIEDIEHGEVGTIEIGWKKKRNEFEAFVSDSHTISCLLNEKAPWNRATGDYNYTEKTQRTLCTFPENIALVVAEHDAVDAAREERSEKKKPLNALVHQIQHEQLRLWLIDQHAAFLEEYEDDEDGSMWQDYRKKLKDGSKPDYPDFMRGAAKYLVQDGIEVNGLTVEQLVETAQPLGFTWKKEDVPEYWDQIKGIVLDLSYDGENPLTRGDDEEDEFEGKLWS